MKKILIFLFISLYIIKASEIKVVLSRPSYYKIDSEVKNVSQTIYGNCIILKNTYLSLNYQGRCRGTILVNVHSKMPTAYKILNIQHSDEKIEVLINELLNVFLENQNGNIIQNYFQPLIFQFLYSYGYPSSDFQFLTLKEKYERVTANIPNDIFIRCQYIPYKSAYLACVGAQITQIILLLPSNYRRMFEEINVVNQIGDKIFGLEETKEKIILKIKEIFNNAATILFTSSLYENDSTIALYIEQYFSEINSNCFTLTINDDIRECVKPNIISIYNLLPFDIEETSDWIINEFMMKLPSSMNKMDMLVKIFLDLNIKSQNNNTRLLTEGNYGVVICRWFVSWFCLDNALCD